jgi:hypothetical protein
MTFEELNELTTGRTFPLAAENQDGEVVIIEAGRNKSGDRFFRLTTAQDNGWTRINYIWEDGTIEELFQK